jgi:hypothetical protein
MISLIMPLLFQGIHLNLKETASSLQECKNKKTDKNWFSALKIQTGIDAQTYRTLAYWLVQSQHQKVPSKSLRNP